MLKARIVLTEDGTMILKAGPGRAGLVQKQITDKNGRKQTKWVRTGTDQSAPRKKGIMPEAKAKKPAATGTPDKKRKIPAEDGGQGKKPKPGNDHDTEIRRKEDAVKQAQKELDAAKDAKKTSKRQAVKDALKNFMSTLGELYAGRWGSEEVQGGMQEQQGNMKQINENQKREQKAGKRLGESKAEKKKALKNAKGQGMLF
jgi:hypothetical protein